MVTGQVLYKSHQLLPPSQQLPATLHALILVTGKQKIIALHMIMKLGQ